MRGLLPIIVLCLLGTGCVTVPPKGGFKDVERLSSERGVGRIHWIQGTAADREVDRAVGELLSAELSATSAVQVALLRNPSLQATFEDLAVAQADLVQAGLLKNPVFDAEFRIQEGTGNVLFEGTLMTQFVELLLIPMRKRVAEAEFEAAKLRVASEVLNLVGQTRAAFYRVQAQRQLLDMRLTVLESLEASVEVASRVRKAGNITELDLAGQQAQLEQARVELMTAEGEYHGQRERLGSLMGLAESDQWRTGARLDDLPSQEPGLDDPVKHAVERSLQLGAQRQKIIAAAKRLDLSQPLATLLDGEMGASAEHSTEEGWAIGPAVSVPLPLFDQGQARAARAQAELRRARQIYHAVEINTRAEVREAVIRVQQARKRVEHYRDVLLPLRRKIVEQTQLQYNAMQLGVTQLLAARREQIEEGAQSIRSLREYWLARTELDQIVNGALPRNQSTGASRESDGQGD